MLKIISSWLNKPFPFYENLKEKLLAPLYIALSIILVLVIFNPTRNVDYLEIQFFKVFAYAFIAFSVASFFNIALPKIFNTFFDIEKWIIYKALVFIFAKLLVISLINAVFAFYFDNPSNNIHFIHFLISVLYFTFIVSLVPIIIFIFWLEKRFYKKHYRISQIANQKIHDLQIEKSKEEYIEFESFKITLNSILFVRADGNYCTFYFENGNSVDKTLIRVTLKEVENRINRINIVRCHKSYMVNLQKVDKIEGNARRYSCTFSKVNTSIPISRTLSNNLIEEFKKE